MERRIQDEKNESKGIEGKKREENKIGNNVYVKRRRR